MAAGTGDVEDGGGEGLFAEEADLFLILDFVELGEADGAFFIAGGDENEVGLVYAVFLGGGAVLVDVNVFNRDGRFGIGGGGLGVVAEKGADIAVGLGDGVVVVAVGEGDDDFNRGGKFAKVGAGLGRKGVAVVAGEVEAPGVEGGEVVEPADEDEHEDGLGEQMGGAQPACGAEAGGRGGGHYGEGRKRLKTGGSEKV